MLYAGILALFVAVPEGDVPGPSPVQGNLALGCSVQVTPRPNYLKDAASQNPNSLTDGKFAAGRLWLDRGTLGWSKLSPISITVDLKRSAGIGSVVFSTAAGRAGVQIPRSILVLTSEDARRWNYAGDLIRAAGEDLAQPSEYTLLRIEAKDLNARGRYVRLMVTPQNNMAFCDEVQIFGGPAGTAEPVQEDLDAFRKRMLVAGGLARRRELDAFAFANELKRAQIPGATRTTLSARLPNHSRTFRKPSAKTKTTYRFPGEEDLKLGVDFAALRRARGMAGVVAWRKHRFDPVGAYEAPATSKPSASVAIETLKGETRSDALLLTSSLTKPTDITLTLPGVGLTGIAVAAVPWTDTADGMLVASALPLTPVGTGYRFRLYPGITTRLWLRLNSQSRAVGQTQGQVRLTWSGGKLSVPMRVRVSPVKMARPRIAVGLFDYATGGGAYDLKGPLVPVAIKAMQAHAVDSPWASRSVLPWPYENDFDQQGRLVRPLDTSRLKPWVRNWPAARRFMVFANVTNTFAGVSVGQREFDTRVGAWAKALAAEMRSLKVKPRTLTLLLVDEPNSDEQARLTTAWARAIRRATPEIALMTDPGWADESRPAPAEALQSVDVVTQQVERLVDRPERAQLRTNQTLWLYQAAWGAKSLDPSQYYRLQSWFALRYGAKGVSFWSLSDDGGAPSSFQELAARAPSASPAFLDRTKVIDSVHWQAMLEGIQDYEIFQMLRASAKTSARRSQVEALIREATDAVLVRYYPGDIRWTKDRKRGTADQYRSRAIKMLEGSA